MKMKRNRKHKSLRRRLLAWELATTLVILCLDGLGQIPGLHIKTQAASVEKDITSKDHLWTYRKLSGNKIVLTSSLETRENWLKTVIIPSEVDGFTVTALDSYNDYEDSGWNFWKLPKVIEDVLVTNGVERIGRGVFSGCTFLETVTLSDSVKRLGDSAFAGCTALKEFTDIDSIQVIGNNAFQNCTALKEIDLSQNVVRVGDSAFAGCISLENAVDSAKIKHYGTGVFYHSGLKKMDLYGGSGVPESMFARCNDLEEVHVSNDSGAVGAHAFEECGSLLYVGIDNLESAVGDYAFNNCNELRVFEGGSSICPIKIGRQAFYHTTSLWSFSQSTTAYAVKDSYDCDKWWKSKIAQICYPEWAGGNTPSDEELNASHVNKGDALSVPLLSFNCDSIGDMAFYESGITCISLYKANDPDDDSVIRIGNFAFEYSKLKSVVLKDNSELDDGVFQYCESLRILSNSDNVDPSNADTNADILKAGLWAFEETPWLEEHMESGMALSVSRNNSAIVLQADKDYDFGDLKLPDNVTAIAPGAFDGNTKLKSLTLQRKTDIGGVAFEGCTSLESVTEDGGSLGEVGQDAFQRTPWLQEQQKENLTILDDHILVACETSWPGEVVIPKEVTQIAPYAFYGCKEITSISFEEREKPLKIGAVAFGKCSSLQKITFPENVSIRMEGSGGLFTGCNALQELVIPKGWIVDDTTPGRTSSPLYSFINSNSMKKVTIHAQGLFDEKNIVKHSVAHTLETMELGEEIVGLPDNALDFFSGKLIYTSKLTTAGDYVFGRGKGSCWKSAVGDEDAGGCLVINGKLMYAWDGSIREHCLDENGQDRGFYLKGVTTIAGDAFQEWGACIVQLDDTVTGIADDAFAAGTLIVAQADSYAADWSWQHGFDCVTPEELGTEFVPFEWQPGQVVESSAPKPSDSQKPDPSQGPDQISEPSGSQDPWAIGSNSPSPDSSMTPGSSAAPSETGSSSDWMTGSDSVWKLRVVNVKVVRKGISYAALKLQWSSGNTSDTSYQVYRSLKKQSGYRKLATTDKTRYIDTKVQKGVTYYYQIRKISGTTQTSSEAVAATVTGKLLKPAIAVKSTSKTYIIILKRSEGTRYEFQLRMKGFNNDQWFSAARYRGRIKKKIIMKRNSGSATFDLRLRTGMKIGGKWKNSSWSKTVHYKG